MKKLSLLIALCMLISIGGVYAVWTYPGETMESQTEPFVSKMGDIGHTGSAGSYTFSGNSIDFSIEPKDNNQETKLTSIVWGAGQVTLTFVANDNISADAKHAALNATISIVNTSATLGEYDSQAIYTLDSTKVITLTEGSWNTSDNQTYTCTITAEMLKDLEAISITEFALLSQDDYDLFKTANAAVRFAIKVTPGALS